MTRTKDDFLVFGSPEIAEDEIQSVVHSLKSGWLGTGPKVMQFQEDFAAYKGALAGHAIAVNSCTAALHLSLLAANLKPGDEVITTPITFCATINAILHAGAKPVLADVDPVTMNLDPVQVAAKITPRTKAVIPVHFAGRPCDMDAFSHLTKHHQITLIEDCAHAIETQYRGQPAGTFGAFGCFSFYVTKNITTGEGGMILTQTADHVDRLKILALHGMSKDAWKRFSDEGYNHYQVVEAGFKYNMMDLQAAIGIHQLQRVTQSWQRRQDIWNRYNEALSDLPITRPPMPEEGTVHGYHLYTILIDPAKTGLSRDQFLMTMHEQNIGTGVHYLSVPEHPYYQEHLGWHPEDYPHAMRIGRQTVSLPLSPKLSDRDVEDVIEAVRHCLNMPPHLSLAIKA